MINHIIGKFSKKKEGEIVNKCLEDVGLGNIFINFLLEKKIINFFDFFFFISDKTNVKIFIK